MCCIAATGDLVSKLKGYEDEEEEEDEEDMMAVQGSDGQQYVVLEVIQLADNQGAEQVSIIPTKYEQLEEDCPFGQLIINVRKSTWILFD